LITVANAGGWPGAAAAEGAEAPPVGALAAAVARAAVADDDGVAADAVAADEARPPAAAEGAGAPVGANCAQAVSMATLRAEQARMTIKRDMTFPCRRASWLSLPDEWRSLCRP